MTFQERLKLLLKTVEENEDMQHKLGIEGTYTCPGCKCTKPLIGSMDEPESDLVLCRDCYLGWGEAKLKGLVDTFQDVLPATDLPH